MKDQDNELMNKVGKGILIFIVISFLMITFFSNRLEPRKSKIAKIIEKKENIFILITDSNCNNCKEIKNYLKENNIYFVEANLEKTADKKVLTKYKVFESDIIVPTLVYIENKQLVSSLPNISDYNQIDLFINNYNKE